MGIIVGGEGWMEKGGYYSGWRRVDGEGWVLVDGEGWIEKGGY